MAFDAHDPDASRPPCPHGTKYDRDKPRPELLPPRATLAVAEVLAYGARKYAEDNWRGVEPPTRYLGAALRHILARLAGERLDPESGLPHLACACASLLFRLERDLEPTTTVGPAAPAAGPEPEPVEWEVVSADMPTAPGPDSVGWDPRYRELRLGARVRLCPADPVAGPWRQVDYLDGGWDWWPMSHLRAVRGSAS